MITYNSTHATSPSAGESPRVVLRYVRTRQNIAGRPRRAPWESTLDLRVKGSSDPAIWDYETEYLLGDDIVVNLVTELGRGPWRTYTPTGSWIDP